MIRIGKGVMVEGSEGEDNVKLLWDLLNVVGFRFVIVAPLNGEELDIIYSDKYQVVKWKNKEVLLFNCSSETDFKKILSMLGDSCITEFYITVNSYYDNVLNKVDSSDMFSDKNFLIDEYLIEFPRTVHIEENKFYIDFETFKEYTYQLQRAALRYMK